jgi:glutamyl-tRNA synthetase
VPGDTPRVRFAPSPTGFLHVGSARAALFNWVVARQSGGTLVLRIEDTDTERNREEWVDGILSALHWLGMDADEGPYRQSQRRHRYDTAVEALWNAGHLYACDCTREVVDARTKGNAIPGYDGFCRDRGLERGDGRAIRYRAPDAGSTIVVDVIRGEVEFPHAAMEDFVVVKSNGQPLFVLANVVDDIDMAITHVIRGEDLLPTTPKGLLLWGALASSGWQTDGLVAGAPSPTLGLPVFAHLPLLVNEQGKKLSKRRDSVAVESYREQGYLPEAFVNYLALLGWGPPGGEELFDVDQLLREFRLERVNHSPAFFDVVKLKHMNGEYIRALSVDDFIDASQPWLTGPEAPWPPENFDARTFARMAPLVQERVALLSEVPAMVDFFFVDQPVFDPNSWTKAYRDEVDTGILEAAISAYESLASGETAGWTADALHQATQSVGERFGRKLGKAQAPIRVAVTGRQVGPPLFESLVVLGPDRVLARMRAVLERLPAPS